LTCPYRSLVFRLFRRALAGERFETAVYIVISVLWTYLTAVFAWVAW